MKIEDTKYQSSAQYLKDREHPIECLNGDLLGQDTDSNQSDSKFMNKILKIRDYFNWKKEKWKFNQLTDVQKKSEAKRVYSNYYKFLYMSKNGDPEKLKNLIKIYGSPDYANPYGKDHIEYNAYNEFGFLFSEIEAVLLYCIMKKDIKVFFDNIKEEDEFKIIDHEEKERVIKENFETASLSLVYIFYYSHDFSRLFDLIKRNVIHPDNVIAALIEIILYIDFSTLDFSRDDFIKAISKKKIVNEDDLRVILNYKEKVEN